MADRQPNTPGDYDQFADQEEAIRRSVEQLEEQAEELGQMGKRRLGRAREEIDQSTRELDDLAKLLDPNLITSLNVPSGLDIGSGTSEETTPIGIPLVPGPNADPTKQSLAAVDETEVDQGPSITPSKTPTTVEIELQLIGSPEQVKELTKLLREGKVEEFNQQRPAGRLDLRGQKLSGLNLEGIDLRHADCSGADLSGCKLDNAMCQHTLFTRADLSRTRLDNGKFFQAKFHGTELENVASAIQADFQHAEFVRAKFSNGNFNKAYFNNGIIASSELTSAKFVEAQMQNITLVSVGLTDTNFQRANFHQANMLQANGEDVDFRGAIFTQARSLLPCFSSSNKNPTNIHPGKTTFEGAWIKDFVHEGSIAEEFLQGAQMAYPPENIYEQAPDPDKGEMLLNGIPNSNRIAFDNAMAKMHRLIGQDKVKKQVEEIASMLEVSCTREVEHGLARFAAELNILILGPPGVGKNTFAEIFVELYYALGLIGDPVPVETDKGGFVAEYEGQTPNKTNRFFDDLFNRAAIADEIYAMSADNGSFSNDAISVMVRRLEKDRGKYALLCLGYEDKMAKFLKSNAGLARRFPEKIVLQPYTTGELIDISRLMLDDLDVANYDQEFLATNSVLLGASKILKTEESFGNGGDVRNIVNKVCRSLSRRLKNADLVHDKEAQQTPKAEDLPFEDDQVLGIPREKFPALDTFTWITNDGKEISYQELPIDSDYRKGEFPSLSEKSLAILEQIVEQERANTSWVDFEE